MKSVSVLLATAAATAALLASPAMAVDCTPAQFAQVMGAQTDASIAAACASVAIDASKPMSIMNLNFCKSDACLGAIKKVVATLPDCSMNGISVTMGTAALLSKCQAEAKDTTPPPVPTRPDGSPVPVPTGADGKPLPPPNGPPPNGPPPNGPPPPGTVKPAETPAAKKEEVPVPTTVKPATTTVKPATNTTNSNMKETANATATTPTEEPDAGFGDTTGSSSSSEEETTINLPKGGAGSAESAEETPKPSATKAPDSSMSLRVTSSTLATSLSAAVAVVLAVAIGL